MKQRIFLSLLFLTLFALGLGVALRPAAAVTAAPAAMPDNPPNDLPDSPIAEFDLLVVRVYYNGRAELEAFTSWLEPWEVVSEKGYAVVGVNHAEYARLQAMGYRLELDEALTLQVNQPLVNLPGQISGIPGYACYRTVEETYATAQQIANDYPQLATWTDIGDSWEKTAAGGLSGYDMMVLKLTNSAVPGPKPALFVMSSIHAREYTPAELNTRFAEYLVQNYGSDPDVTWLLDYHEIHLLLQSNPDGRKHAETGESWRKNTNQNYCGATSTSRGADLNRNFAFQWGCCGGSSTYQCDETYRGPYAASEPEVLAVENYVTSTFPDQRGTGLTDPAPIDATGIFIDLHSYSELVLWPWGFTNTVAPNGIAMQTLGRKFAYFNGYHPEQSIGLYPTDGTTDDFAYGELGVAAYTMELGTSFFQSCGTFESTILPDNLQALLYAAKSARTPYMTAGGPDALDVQFSTGAVAAGDPVTLTATVNDTRYNNQNGTEPTQRITAAEYYIDVPPWITMTTPIPYAMAPSDGAFSSTVEGVTGTLDTSGLGSGRHIIYVRGQDLSGTWGVVSAAFLFVIDPAVAPTIGGQVRAADTGLPLEADIHIGTLFQTTASAVTGLYETQVVSGTYDITAVPTDSTYGSRTLPDVVAQDYQSVQADFVLYPYCEVIRDDVEGGNIGWTGQSPWAITTEMSHSTSHSWTDSPGGSYSNYRDITLTSPVFDLTNYSDVHLNFWQICNTEAGYDFCSVEVSPDGVNWATLASYDGPHSVWQQIDLAASQLDKQSQAQIRFHFTSDESVTADGWHIDDVALIGAGPDCVEYMIPTAGFNSTSPDGLGETTQFTSASIGTDLNYFWDFGDASAVITETNPAHVYASTGSFTVTLTVSNTLGSDTAVHTVDILQLPTANFTGTTMMPIGETAVFTNTSTGDNLTFQWDFGDGNPVDTSVNPTHIYDQEGTFTVTLTVSSPVGTSVKTQPITVYDPYPIKILLPLVKKE